MKSAKSPNEYYSGDGEWQEILLFLRSCLLTFNELEESIKWGVPAYLYQGKILIGVASFKNYAGLWFHQGALLKDKQKLLVNAQEGKTQALRQMRFTRFEELDKEAIMEYIAEAIENQKLGKVVKIEPKKEIVIPSELQNEFENAKALQKAFKELTPGRQREYAEHIASAKREATRIARLEKCIPMILAKQGLHDKYKNC